MDFNVHDSSGREVGIVENPAESLWVRKYQKPGEFELYLPATPAALALIMEDCYITREDAPEVMIVEHVEIVTSQEDGDFLLVKGRGAEALFERRIIWEQTAIAGRVDAAIYKLVQENAISPADPARELPITMQEHSLSGFDISWELGSIATSTGLGNASTTRFRGADYIPIGNGLHITMAETQRVHLYYYDAEYNYLGYSGWHSVTSYLITANTYEGAAYIRMIFSYRDNSTISNLAAAAASVEVHHGISAQYTGNNLLETVQEICAAYGLGFRAVHDNADNADVVPHIELLEGVDRSEGQSKNSHVMFATEYDNLMDSTYVLDTSNYKNVVKVAGEGEGKARKSVTRGTASGMHRRELFVDARDMSTNNGEISAEEYNAMLAARGAESIAEHTVMESFDGEIDTSNNFILDADYTLGDIVTIENDYGIRKNVRIATIMESWDDTGYAAIPTFENVEV